MIDLTICVFFCIRNCSRMLILWYFVRDVQLHETLTPSADLNETPRFAASLLNPWWFHLSAWAVPDMAGDFEDLPPAGLMMRKVSNAIHKLIHRSRRKIDLFCGYCQCDFVDFSLHP